MAPASALSNYSTIVIASSFGGQLRRAELDALIARSADIAAFINAGAGLFASAECDNCGGDLLGVSPNMYGYLPIVVTLIGVAVPFTVTAYGAAAPFNLTDSDLNSPTHTSFGLTGGLNVVDTDSAGNATTLAGNITIDGGGFHPTPEPSSIALAGLALAALGLSRRQRRATPLSTSSGTEPVFSTRSWNAGSENRALSAARALRRAAPGYAACRSCRRRPGRG